MIQPFLVPALIVLSAGLVLLAVLCLRGHLLLKKQIREGVEKSANAASSSETAADEKVAALREQLESLRAHLDELEKRRSVTYEEAPMLPPPAPALFNRRGQVMRLHRSGESAASIASAFGVSQGEVKLIVKVQELLSENAAGENFENSL